MACQTTAKVLQRSVGRDAPPLTSFQLRYPLQIHAELMTHRMFSRNARSSRAVPTARMIEEVMTDPFVPRYWGANQKGMQAGAEHNDLVWLMEQNSIGEMEMYDYTNEEAWLWGRDQMVKLAQAYATSGYHKQIANRLLAPFLHIDVVVTTTDLSNWDALRDHEMAEPHIRDLARAMKEAVADYGEPTLVHQGSWHLPYVGVADYGEQVGDWPYRKAEYALRAMSVTRCAQVSYTPFHEAKLTIDEEVARHDALINARPMHASPAEHQATPDIIVGRDELGEPIWANPKLHGNLTGWVQYRKTLSGERA